MAKEERLIKQIEESMRNPAYIQRRIKQDKELLLELLDYLKGRLREQEAVAPAKRGRKKADAGGVAAGVDQEDVGGVQEAVLGDDEK